MLVCECGSRGTVIALSSVLVVNSDGLTWFVYYHNVERARTSCWPNNEVLDYAIHLLCWLQSALKIKHEFINDCFEV